MNVLLTGSFGTLGCYVLDYLLEKGHQVTCFDISNKANRKQAIPYIGKPNVSIEWGDVRDHALITSLVLKQDAVIHLAAILPPTTEDLPELTWQVNVEATAHILKAISHSSTDTRFVFASSVSIYGDQQYLPPPRTAEDRVFECDEYTRQKVACERLIKAHKKPWSILRVGVSLDARLQHADRRLVKKMFHTHAGNRMEYVHPADVAIAMVHAAEREEASYKTLLIGGGKSCQINQLDLVFASFGALGMNFKASDLGTNNYYTDWMDTEESQQILEFQHLSFKDFEQQMQERMRLLRLLILPLSPIVKPLLLRWFKH